MEHQLKVQPVLDAPALFSKLLKPKLPSYCLDYQQLPVLTMLVQLLMHCIATHKKLMNHNSHTCMLMQLTPLKIACCSRADCILCLDQHVSAS